MGEKIVVGPFNRGLRNDVTPFNVDNESFPVLINAYQWRGRVKRKRGTSLLCRLTRFFNSLSTSYNSGSTTITLDGSGVGNLLTGFSLQTNGNIVPGSVTLTGPGGPFTDPTLDGYLTPTGTGGPNTINYATGEITIPAQAGSSYSAVFRYFPDLPVMGLEDLILATDDFPETLGFDTKYSYNIPTSFPYNPYDVSFYKNPAVNSAYPGYVPKANPTPTSWNGQDYQQFWTVNYQGALWATNGITVPFTTANIGMQFNPITNAVINSAGPPAIVTLTIANHGLVVGDFVFINEIVGMTGINWQTGYVIAVIDANTVQVEFPNAQVGGAYASGGIAQYLTNRSDVTKDSLRWYDGDPTNGSSTSPALTGTRGWVNFSPPLSQAPFSISDLPEAVYYLVGARMIVPFKDRLLFIGPVVQTSDANSQQYLQDTVIFSQNGTAYYTSSYTNNPVVGTDNPSSPTIDFHPVLVPENPTSNSQTATAPAYFEDVTGFGGYIQAGIDQPINTTSSNGDVLLLGFTTIETQLVYSGNDVLPFNFFVINSELGSGSTFSAINMDKGAISRGERGYIITNPREVQRIDLEIPDEVFQISLSRNGTERVCSQRDYINEWIYETYPVNNLNSTIYKFPTQTLQYNYRDSSWAIFRESYTTYGAFRKRTGFTWATVGTVYPTWSVWNAPWNAGSSTLLQPEVIAGNQQGFVLVRDDGTNEGNSLYIRDIVGSVVTSPDHSLNAGDYIVISGVLGTVGAQVNGKIFSVSSTSLTANTFILTPPIAGGTYLGGGLIKRMYVPFIQTKQFPTSWDMGRKTRLGVQQYLLTTTDDAQIQLLIFLSQDANNAYNSGPLVPFNNVQNGSLVYSTVLYTCPESTNLGLTPASFNMANAANTNLQMISNIDPVGTNASSPQAQIWHRVNTSLIGDTVQIGFSLSDEQMRDEEFVSQFAEIEVHGIILDVSSAGMLS